MKVATWYQIYYWIAYTAITPDILAVTMAFRQGYNAMFLSAASKIVNEPDSLPVSANWLSWLSCHSTTLTKGKSWDVRARGDGEFGRFVERGERRDPLYKSPPEITTFYTTLQHIYSYHLPLYTNPMSETPHIFYDNFYTTNFYTQQHHFYLSNTHIASYTNRNASISHDLTLTLLRVYLSD